VRRYVVTVRGSLSDAEAERMVAGIDDLRADSLRVRKRSARETHLIVELREGRNREIRRLCGAVGHEVTRSNGWPSAASSSAICRRDAGGAFRRTSSRRAIGAAGGGALSLIESAVGQHG
jgi:hypothetical protein